jgi:pyrophosphatase PpaX
MYKYILLDWDGTLVDTLPLWLKSYHLTAKHYNKEFDDNFITTRLFGNQNGHLEFEADEEEFKRILFGYRIDLSAELRLFDEAYKLLEDIKNSGRKIAIVSSSSKVMIEPALKANKLEDFIDALITGDDVTKHKPDPEPLELAVRLLNGNKAESIMIGDSDKDVLAGQNSNINTMLYYPVENEKMYSFEFINTLNPTYTVKMLSEIMNLL